MKKKEKKISHSTQRHFKTFINFSNTVIPFSCEVAWLAAKYECSIDMYQQTLDQLLTNSGLILGKVVVKSQESVSDILVEYLLFVSRYRMMLDQYRSTDCQPIYQSIIK